MNLRLIHELFAYKKSDVCVFLGSGPSISAITSEEWSRIKQYDTWAVNNWIYHPHIVPDFYHVEVKWYDYPIVSERFREKYRAYKQTKFLFEKGKSIRTKPLHMVVGDMPHKFEYSLVKRDTHRTHAVFSANYVMDSKKLTKSYDISLTTLIELIGRFGYKYIVLFGVDLNDSYYFWTGGDPKYGKVHHQTNKEHEGKDPKLPHNTHKVKDFIVDFNKRWLLPNGREMFVGHTKTLLYPELNHIDILSLSITQPK